MTARLLRLPISSDADINLVRTRLLRFGLPLLLFAIASGFEVWEHWVKHRSLSLDPAGLLEVVIFGVAGPMAVFVALTYVEHLLQTLHCAHADIAALNRDLEHRVAERTAELKQANLRLLESDQMKSDFVSLVSHELRAPLATLNGGLELALQYEAQLPPKAQRILHLLLDETIRLTGFIQTILDVSQLETGRLQPNCGPVAVRPLLVHAVELVLGNDISRVVWKVPPDAPPILADEVYVEQALRNLLRNASGYTPPASPIEIEVKADADKLCICVTDYGPGIPPEQQERVFGRFVRLSTEKGDRPSGWGLGLYFVRSLIQAQGGTVTLISPVHPDPAAPGCRFVITLPIAQEPSLECDEPFYVQASPPQVASAFG